MNLTIVVPTLNEVENVRYLTEQLLELSISDVEQHVLIVDSASMDGTAQAAEALVQAYPDGVGVLHDGPAGGFGSAYRHGFARALSEGADLVLQMDCDLSHPPKYVPDLVEELLDHDADLVQGSRYLPGSSLGDDWPWWRYSLSAFANGMYVRAVLGVPLRDATGGFRIWRSETLRGMDPWSRSRSNGYVFQVEMAYLAHRLGYRMREIPIEFLQRRAGESKMRLGIQLEAAWRVFDVRRRLGRLGPCDRRQATDPRDASSWERVKPTSRETVAAH